MPRRGYLYAGASGFGIKAPKATPGRLMKVGGGSGVDGIIASQRVSNAKFSAATGWKPRYPDVVTGWAAEAASRTEGMS